MLDSFHVVMATDENYAVHLSATLVSLFENNRNVKFIIHVLSLNLSPETIHRISLISRKYGNSVIFENVRVEEYADFPITSYYSYVTFFRLKIADYIDESIHKLLYLDSDTIVTSSIVDLLNVDVANNPIAAVKDTPWQLNYASDNLGFNRTDSYFNAGVMLINVDLFRYANVFEKSMQIVKSHEFRLGFLDQDLLNIIFKDNWRELPCKWNLLNGFLKKDYKDDPRSVDFRNGINERAIIHYSSRIKPWSWRCVHPFKKEYFKYRKLTPWGKVKIEKSAMQRLAIIKNRLLLMLGIRYYPYII